MGILGKGTEKFARGDSMVDVCELFCLHLSSLFYLAYMIAGSMERAETILLNAVDLTNKTLPSNRAYRYPMARRCVIKAAIESLAPEIRQSAVAESNDIATMDGQTLALLGSGGAKLSADALLAIMWKISVFRRFVVIMRVFERYHRTDTVLLLGQSSALVSMALEKGLGELCQATALHSITWTASSGSSR